MNVLFEEVRVFDGARFLSGLTDVRVIHGVIESVDQKIAIPQDAQRVRGGVLFPGFCDAHVHLSFSEPAAVVKRGVTSVLDLGAPMTYALKPHEPLHFAFAGPLITAPGGYPTRSWGADGYGLEVATPAHAASAVSELIEHGVTIVKVAVEPSAGPVPSAEILKAVTETAHSRGLRVAAHALSAAAVTKALEAGVDVLAHTPTEALPLALVKRLAEKQITVISTVRAFGDARSTRRNLKNLAQAGCTIAYGTDLGNGNIAPGIDTAELAIVAEALGDANAAIAAATGVSGEFCGRGGRITPGVPADLVWVPAFRRLDDLNKELKVWIGGKQVA